MKLIETQIGILSTALAETQETLRDTRNELRDTKTEVSQTKYRIRSVNFKLHNVNRKMENEKIQSGKEAAGFAQLKEAIGRKRNLPNDMEKAKGNMKLAEIHAEQKKAFQALEDGIEDLEDFLGIDYLWASHPPPTNLFVGGMKCNPLIES